MKKPSCGYIFIMLFFAACNNSESKNDDTIKRINAFADLECRAMTLKDQRFALANQIRFTQDSMLRTENKANAVRLKSRIDSMNKDKESISQSSLALADSIHTQMEELKSTFKSKDDQAIFYSMLDSTLAKRGCK